MQTHPVAVITGASSGIGAALARRLGRKEFRLVLAARRADALEAVGADIHGDTLPVVADVTRRADVARLRDEALGAFGTVDVWVNNAGRGINASVLDLTDEQLDEMMAVNVKSALYGMQAIVPYFKERGHGHLINVSSFLSRVPLATYRSAYNAAKAALNALTANLRMDLRRQYPEVHVSLVMPGMVTTEFAKNALGGTPAVTWTSPGGGSGPQIQTADDVAAAIESLIKSPREEIYTQRGQPDTVIRYFQDVGAFERGLP
ncbi:MAG TPA: SDR family NAD(P)-dependent oxidoreductase [Gemmatimonadaceae bacterium]|nr:SDR family NAD(P)-dependent oxidoreductase [Gemmatimonadaceae bacterium]